MMDVNYPIIVLIGVHTISLIANILYGYYDGRPIEFSLVNRLISLVLTWGLLILGGVWIIGQ